MANSLLELEPYRLYWKFADSEGNIHEGIDWRIDLVKDLGQEAANI